MGVIGGSRSKGLSSPISRGFGGRVAHLEGEGEEPPPPFQISGRAIILILLLCVTAARTVIVIPLIIPPPILPPRDGASAISSVGWGGPPLGIDA